MSRVTLFLAVILFAGCSAKRPEPSFLAATGPMTQSETDEIDYFPSMAMQVSAPLMSAADANQAILNFIVLRGLPMKDRWSKLRSSTNYFYVVAVDDPQVAVYVRRQGTIVRYFAPAN